MTEENFKYTEIGYIPNDWEVKSLGEITSRITVGIANSATQAYSDRGIIMFRNQNIRENYLDDTDLIYINELFEANYHNKRLKTGDLLISRTGYPGTTCVVPKKYEDTQTFTTLIATPNIFFAESVFLSYYLNSPYGKSFFESAQIGGAQKNVNAHTLEKMPIPLPPLPEQRRIAAALSDIDTLIQKLEILIQKKQNIKQGAMQSLLTGKKRLKGFEGDWCEKKLGDLNFQNGQMLKSSEYVNGLIPVIAGGKTAAGFHNISNRPANTITISGSGASAGFVALHKQPIFASDCTTLNEQENIDIEYLYYYLVSVQNDIYQCQTGGAQPHIHPKDIKDIPLLLPPTLEEQCAISKIFSDMDSEIEHLEEKLDKYKAIKQGMMQQLLSGRIRLL